jgi:hypothetical protein
MFSITISFGNPATMWTLMWRDKEKAIAAIKQFSTVEDSLIVSDDFGQEAHIKRADIHGVMLEDMELSKLAHIERALHQARVQAQGQQAAENDQVLRAQRARSGPAVLTPGMNGFPR